MRQRLTFTRRSFLSGLAAGIAVANSRARAASQRDAMGSVADLETEIGGRIGLAVLDTADGRQLSHRADERYAMCSTFKLMLAAAILSGVDGGFVIR